MEQNIYYKVVNRLANGARVSCCAPKELGIRKTYHANGKALSVDEGMVFRSSADAHRFANHWWAQNCKSAIKNGYIENPEVWECTIECRGEAPKYAIADMLSLKKIDSSVWPLFMSNFKKKIKSLERVWSLYISKGEFFIWPTGTVFARGIVLTNKVRSY